MPQLDIDARSLGGPLPNKADLLDYISDMIQELRDLSLQTGCATLTSILDTARLEAAQQGAMAHRSAHRQAG